MDTFFFSLFFGLTLKQSSSRNEIDLYWELFCHLDWLRPDFLSEVQFYLVEQKLAWLKCTSAVSCVRWYTDSNLTVLQYGRCFTRRFHHTLLKVFYVRTHSSTALLTRSWVNSHTPLHCRIPLFWNVNLATDLFHCHFNIQADCFGLLVPSFLFSFDNSCGLFLLPIILLPIHSIFPSTWLEFECMVFWN